VGVPIAPRSLANRTGESEAGCGISHRLPLAWKGVDGDVYPTTFLLAPLRGHGMRKERHEIAVVAPHPIQYQAGLWRGMARHPRFCVDVLFLDRVGVDGAIDPTLNAPMKWDVPLLDGYESEFIRNLSPFRFSPVINRVNPGLYKRLCARHYDAILVHGYLTFSNWIALLAAKRSGALLVYRGEGSLRGRTLHDSPIVNFLKYPSMASSSANATSSPAARRTTGSTTCNAVDRERGSS